MKRSGFFVLAAAVVLFCVTGVQAGHRAKSFTLSPLVGGYLFDSDLDIDDEAAFGGLVGYNFTDHLGLEGACFFSETEVDGTSVDVDTVFGRLDGLYHFMPEQRLVPYVAIGAGCFSFDPDDADDEDELSVNIGGGIKYFLTDDIALRADLREVSTFPENSLLYSAGVTVYLGSGKKAVPASATPPRDSDGDGVYDDRDQCPGTPSGVSVDAAGCPADSDNDGVLDVDDQCPDTPAGAAVDKTGCTPSPEDSDRDGVINDRDQCPDTPRGAEVDSRGCWVIKNLEFAVGRDEIQPQYYSNLNQVVSVLKMNPGLRVEIQGHTDSQGSQALNEDLSQRRASEVRAYLIDQGIAARRLTARGYGPSQPAASNDTPEGRAKNRRVEIQPLD